MEEDKRKNIIDPESEQVEQVIAEQATINAGEESVTDAEKPLDKNVRLLSPTRMVIRRFLRSKLSIAGLVMLAVLFLFCWFGPVVYTRWGETESDRSKTPDYTFYTVSDENGVEYVQAIVTYNDINKLAPPSAEHILGTDEQGMDIFTRLMYGGRLSLTISFIAVFLTSALGIIMGGIAGYYGGWVDNATMWFINVVWSIPTVLLVIAITFALGKGFWQVFVAVGLTMWVDIARVVRGQVMSLKEKEYVEAARALGFRSGRIIFHHILPNTVGPSSSSPPPTSPPPSCSKPG